MRRSERVQSDLNEVLSQLNERRAEYEKLKSSAVCSSRDVCALVDSMIGTSSQTGKGERIAPGGWREI